MREEGTSISLVPFDFCQLTVITSAKDVFNRGCLLVCLLFCHQDFADEK